MSQFHTLTVAKVQQPTRDSIAVTFAVPPALAPLFAFDAGQHLTLRAMLDGEEVRRSYSICSGTHEGELRVAIKRTPGGVFSTWALEHLRPGAAVDVMPPTGHFILPVSTEGCHYLAFAAGSGITPILSIIKTALAARPDSRFTLVYGNRATSSVIFRAELADLKDQYLERLAIVHVMSREQQDIDLFNGRIDKDKCAQLLRHWIRLDDIDQAFICGPEPMMLAVQEALLDAGMAKERIRIELFAPGVPSQRARPTEGPRHETQVTVVMDGGRSDFAMDRERESILDAGLRAGLDLRYSCKAGVCATCRCKLVEGRVEMDATYALEDYEIARGFILSCQSFPLTYTVTVDFDQAE